MAYNPYYTQFYPVNPYVQPTITSQVPPQQSQSNNGITWVQGESAAKSYPVAPNNSVLLMDSENPVMYIKSTDQSGMPQPLRIFDYTERKSTQKEPLSTPSEVVHTYASHDELDALRGEFDALRNELKDELKKSTKAPTRKIPIKEE